MLPVAGYERLLQNHSAHEGYEEPAGQGQDRISFHSLSRALPGQKGRGQKAAEKGTGKFSKQVGLSEHKFIRTPGGYSGLIFKKRMPYFLGLPNHSRALSSILF